MKPTTVTFAVLSVLLSAAPTAFAQQGDRKGHEMAPPPAEWNIPPAPVVPPAEAVDTFALEEGFRAELIASEPLVHDPVAIAFDGNGRIWVVELRGYMPDVEGKGEDAANGRITILDDSDGDGVMDKVTVFLDGIVLPRSIALVEGGILYGDQKQLFFVENNNNQPGEITVIDEEWAKSGNVEHKTNGLMPALDNWLYNAKSDARYRKIDGDWVKEKTEYRGQWGISQDDFGRLYTNTNSNLITAEYVWPGARLRNPNHEFASRTGIGMNNAVWPIRITCGINRGYQQGMLTAEGYLTKVTATCGPVVYRGDRFPADYRGNLFIPEPVGLLVKRAIVNEADDGTFKVEAAYQGREFFASTDERSRIVNAYNAPDGTLYFVDFYRGIVQHKTYVTSYLRRQILERELDKQIGLGRIFRIVHQGAAPGPRPKMLNETPAQWVAHLSHANGWWRDTAQRLLVQRGDVSVVPALRQLVAGGGTAFGSLHAMWTLEGLGEVRAQDIAAVLKQDDDKLAANALRVAGELLDGDAAMSTELAGVLSGLDVPKSPVLRRQLAATLGSIGGDSRDTALAQLGRIVVADKSALTADMALSGLAGNELAFFKIAPKDSAVLTPLMAAIVKSGDAEAIGQLADAVLAADDAGLVKRLAQAAVRGRSGLLSERLLEVAAKSGDAGWRDQVVAGMKAGKSGKFKPIKLTGGLPAGFSEKQQAELAKLFALAGAAEEKSFIVSKADKALFELGKANYQKVCLACHQPTGQGLQFIAPPLVDSEWVDGPEKRLIALVMDGMTGPVTVNGKTYDVPEVQPVMPGLRVSPDFDDKAIAAMLTYVRNEWGNRASVITEDQVEAYRKAQPARAPWPAQNLLKIK